ncbi:MAG: glycosyltransferase [Muribaculaceae bacterium]|nr:glycosyltransferase [Muribaculaceae bacterium]MDE6753218.1 glycosyltransferase [Muribaculaceae bacterium]
MRILHILTTIYQGGVRSVVLDMVKAQKKAGNEVAILCLLNEDRYFNNTKEFEELGVKLYRGIYSNNKHPLHISVIRKYLQNYDIVHIHLFPNQLFSKIAFYLIPNDKRPVLITTEHSTFNNRRKYSVLRHLDRWFYKTYSKIVCISKAAEDNLKGWLKMPELDDRIVTITNGVDIKKYGAAENNLPSVIDYKSDKRYIVMVARMNYPKDPLTLVKSITYCPENVDLIFIGGGALNESIREEAEKLKVQDRIHILGNRDDVPQLLKGCHIGVLSTKWDGFGLVAVEYMAAGLPVLATDVEGLKDVVGDRESLFPYEDYKELGKKITRLVQDNKYWLDKKDYGLDRCKLFSVDKMNEKYLALYSQSLKEAGKSR